MSEADESRQAIQQASEERFPQAAEELAALPPEEQAGVLSSLPDEQAVEVFQYMDAAYQEQVLEHLTQQQVARLIERLDPDDRARLLEQMPVPLARRLLSGLSSRERRMTSLLLGYPEESAGRYMTPEFLALRPEMSVAEALERVRREGEQAETVYVLPVIDEGQKYVGIVHLRDLVTGDPETRISSLIEDLEPVLATDDRESTARLIQTTDSLAAPVVDQQRRLLGLVTMDDAMDILDQEEGEDLARAGGANPLNRPYFSVSLTRLARARVVWLLVLGIAAVLTVGVQSIFRETLASAVTLALFIPLLIGIGGNCGAQSATTVVRAMSLGEIIGRDLLRVILREMAVGAILGGMLALISVAPVWLFTGQAAIAAVIALTLLAICLWATMAGALVPIVAERLGIDPAVASAPFITTLIDASGLIVYFLIARAILF